MILCCIQNLKKTDMIGSSDPYVLINLLGTNIKPIKTKSIKNNLNPVWNESFSFNVSIDSLYPTPQPNRYNIDFQRNEMAGKTVVLQIFDKDTMKDEALGEVSDNKF